MNILISRCLLGFPCRYDGKSSDNEKLNLFIDKYKDQHNFITICPEVEGGLSTPRISCEIVGDKVLNKEGEDKTFEFNKGAEIAVAKAQKYKAQVAILKSKSPSCGTGIIYDGTFSAKLKKGNGVTSQMLSEYGVYVITEEELDKIEYLLLNDK
jgi:uncharacterized protein YbbK (DUF523 family)